MFLSAIQRNDEFVRHINVCLSVLDVFCNFGTQETSLKPSWIIYFKHYHTFLLAPFNERLVSVFIRTNTEKLFTVM